jgi:hypothetical protein
MPWQWIADGNGFAVRKLPTRYGPLDFRIHATGEHAIQVEIADTITLPPGGLSIIPPLPVGKRICPVKSERGECVIAGNELHIHALPCAVEVLLK